MKVSANTRPGKQTWLAVILAVERLRTLHSESRSRSAVLTDRCKGRRARFVKESGDRAESIGSEREVRFYCWMERPYTVSTHKPKEWVSLGHREAREAHQEVGTRLLKM